MSSSTEQKNYGEIHNRIACSLAKKIAEETGLEAFVVDTGKHFTINLSKEHVTFPGVGVVNLLDKRIVLISCIDDTKTFIDWEDPDMVERICRWAELRRAL